MVGLHSFWGAVVDDPIRVGFDIESYEVTFWRVDALDKSLDDYLAVRSRSVAVVTRVGDGLASANDNYSAIRQW